MMNLDKPNPVDLQKSPHPAETSAAVAEQPPEKRAKALRFAYASGARPLSGYTIKRGVGVGGFGEVYFVVSDAGKEVALKRIQRNMDVELRGVSQCLNLKHPNLVALYDIRYDDDNQAWVVMEYIAGESLNDLLDDRPHGLDEDEARRWFGEIARGVAYLHDHGVVHRDLKPGNVFLDEDCVKIGDYGLAKFISCSRRSGQTESVGTFHYMAPEIGRGVYGKEVDVYALGVILYEMLTGDVPFDGESSQEIIMKHLTADPDLAVVPEPYRRVIGKALAKDPQRRYHSAQEMLAALENESDGGPEYVLAEEDENDASASFVNFEKSEPIYIGDDGVEDPEIKLGPVRQMAVAEPVPRQSGAARGVSNGRVHRAPARGRGQCGAQLRNVNHAGRGAAAAGGAAAVAVTAEEPIARVFQSGWVGLVNWWNLSGTATPIKLLLLAVGLFVVVVNAGWLAPLAVALGLCYMLYYPLWALFRTRSQTREEQRRRERQDPMGRRRRPFEEIAREALRSQPASERVSDLTGSFLLSAVVCAVLALVMMVIGGKALDTSVYTYAFYAWLALSSAAATWSLLAVGKGYEGSSGDAAGRRFTMLVLGLALGAGVWGAGEFLGVDLNDGYTVRSASAQYLPEGMYAADGAPTLTAFMAYFAGLFVVLRWWRQTDPLRSSRLSLLSVGACMLWAYIWAGLLEFPQPWGVLLAGIISISAQLASPWMSSHLRAQVRREYQEA